MNFTSKAYFIVVGIILAFMTSGCVKNEEVIEEVTSVRNDDNQNQDHTINAVLWTQTAAEYKALCYQTYNLAKNQLKYRFQNHAFPYDLPPAIIMDLDETVLDNSFFNAQLILDSANYNRDRWMEWSDLMKAGAVPGAIEFINYANELGVNVFFVSNRRVEELHNTMKNLYDLGLTDLDSNQFYLKLDENSKNSRRELISINHEILMLFGDNLADFSTLFDKRTLTDRADVVDSLQLEFGNSFIILPNILYGEWEGAIFDYSYDWNLSQKDSIRRNWLQGY